ncbi:MAG: hypothetical protein JRH11_13185 [Deltaproteobacteria bacterium]|nr:hypothetical protein [Deltaproteobacteria bacterium]
MQKPDFQKLSLDAATAALLGKLSGLTRSEPEEVVARALKHLYDSIVSADAGKAALSCVQALASDPMDEPALAELRRLCAMGSAAGEYRTEFAEEDLLFHFVTAAWEAALEGERALEHADTDEDRVVISLLLSLGLRPDREADDGSSPRTMLDQAQDEEGLVLTQPASVLRFLADLGRWLETEEPGRQRDWLRQGLGLADDALDRIERRGLGFNGQATVALIAGEQLDDVTPTRWLALKEALSARDDLVLVPSSDLTAWAGEPISAVVGLPVQVAYAKDGVPEEVERTELRAAVDALDTLDLTGLGDGGARGLFMITSGQLASGQAVVGKTGKADDQKNFPDKFDGEFFIGSDMSQEKHRYGVWGRGVAFVSWEDGGVTQLDDSEVASVRDTPSRLYLVPWHD